MYDGFEGITSITINSIPRHFCVAALAAAAAAASSPHKTCTVTWQVIFTKSLGP